MIFLRPWFLLFLLIPLLFMGTKHLKHTQTPWEKFIDKRLLSALLIKGKEDKSGKLFLWIMLLLWGMWTLALAGPAFYKLPTPAVQSAPNTVIVFDLSMQAKKILQGQAKLYDLLSALKGERVGLVLFGQNQGYTAMPLTPDTDLIKEIVPSLIPDVLPEAATNPKAGFEYAEKLLDNAGNKGRILYITDHGINWRGNYPFGILDLENRSADASDIQTLLNRTKQAEASADYSFSGSADVWADLGGWIVLLSLPLFAWMFRKGILFLVLFLLTTNVEAGFLWRTDQKIYQTEQKGVEAYQNKDYQAASKLFQQSGNLYNLGNALAFSGDIQGAIEAYKGELEKNPTNQDAQFNKEYLEKQLPPPEEKAQQNEDGQSQDNKNSSDNTSNENQENNTQGNQKQEEKGDKNQSQDESKAQVENQPTQEQTQAELEKALADYTTESSYNQEEQQIINRLNHDPARVLRYRLMLQHEKGNVR